MTAALELHEVTYRYAGATAPALRDVSLRVGPGQLVVVCGPSAGGKSTLVRAACGLVPHFHGGELGGEIRVAGLDLRDHGPGALAAVCGTLLQDAETQVLMGTVRTELAFPLENRGLDAGAVARAVEETALSLGIGGLLDRPTGELSGGELQRVALGAAIAGRPALLVLDEPSSQLDPVAGDELVGVLRRLNEDHDTAIVVAEHRVERFLTAADRVVVLDAGRVVCDAPPDAFLDWAATVAPELCPPAARMFAAAGLAPLPRGVKGARATLRAHGRLPETPAPASCAPPPPPRRLLRRVPQSAAVLRLRGVWHEPAGGPAVLRGVDLALDAGERVALMGRNGAGKTTLLRHAAGLVAPTRGRVESAGRVALLPQHPGDVLLHERAGDEAPPEALAAAGLDGVGDRHPHDLSGGQRQRLALAAVLGPAPAEASVLCLDEPTRGLGRAARDALAARLRALPCALLVATHDAELAAALADRVVLLGEGRVLADGPVRDLLCHGTYFTTEVARVLGGAGGALLAEEGAALLRAPAAVEVPG